MSALHLPENVFKLPKRPRIIEKAAPPDQRSHAVLPIRAVTDKRLTDGQFRALAAICSYCNRAGITWVSQKRLATDMQVSQQAISKHMRALVSLGYLEVTRKGFRAEKPDTHRVIYDPTISQEDAIAVTSSIEDTRPPELKREQIRESAPQEPEFTPEQMAANRQRLREMLGGLAGRNGTFHFNQPQRLGDIMATTKPKRKSSSHTQPNTVVNAEGSHIQPRSQPNAVVQNMENIGYLEVIGLYEEIIKRRFKVLDNFCTTEQDVKIAELLAEAGVTAADVDGALTEHLPMAEMAEKILNAKADR